MLLACESSRGKTSKVRETLDTLRLSRLSILLYLHPNHHKYHQSSPLTTYFSTKHYLTIPHICSPCEIRKSTIGRLYLFGPKPSSPPSASHIVEIRSYSGRKGQQQPQTKAKLGVFSLQPHTSIFVWLKRPINRRIRPFYTFHWTASCRFAVRSSPRRK